MARKKKFTEIMDEQAREAYILCVELLEKLHNGQKVSQAQTINAVAKAWKIHNRFASVYRHNERLKYAKSGWDRSKEMLWDADPDHFRRYVGRYINVDTDIFSSDSASLVDLARELLMEGVDYPTRKIIEQWKTLQEATKTGRSILRELKGTRKDHTEPPLSLWGPDKDTPEPEVDTYLAGIEFGIKETESFLKRVDPFRRWTKKSTHEDVRTARNYLTRCFNTTTEYIDAVLEKYNGYPIEGLARLHNVTNRIARKCCEKGLIEARQIKEAWLIDKEVAESFTPPNAA